MIDNKKNDDFVHQPNLVSVSYLAERLHEELLFNGDSLSYEDVEKSIIYHVGIYMGWQDLHKSADGLIFLDPSLIELELGEWAVLQSVVRCHLDYIQAKRMEGSKAINGEIFGKDVSSAYQDYKLELDELPKKSFCEPPFYL